VIPTIGKPELIDAIESVLNQTVAVHEIFVCVDAGDAPALPSDDRIHVIMVGPGAGGNAARQAGISAATGELIALLDDDDLWDRDRLEMQLDLVGQDHTREWIATCRVRATAPGSTEIWPRRPISADERLTPYILRKESPVGGIGFIQASTLLFPRELALSVPFDTSLKHHQDIDWLIRVDRETPGLKVFQTDAALTQYTIGGVSVSSAIRAQSSIDWAVKSVKDDPRSLGDFILVSGSLYAARAGSPLTVLKAYWQGITKGRPGWASQIFALANFFRAFRWILRHPTQG
jgi:hypothetical protein